MIGQFGAQIRWVGRLSVVLSCPFRRVPVSTRFTAWSLAGTASAAFAAFALFWLLSKLQLELWWALDRLVELAVPLAPH